MAVDFPELHERPTGELRKEAERLGVKQAVDMHKLDLVFEIGQRLGKAGGQLYGRGVLEVNPEGFGFMRSAKASFIPGPDDIYVSQSQIRRCELQTGDAVIGVVRPPKEGERYAALLRVESVNGEQPGDDAPPFESLAVIYPDDRVELCGDPFLRAVDLVAPLGLGQRGIVAGPRKCGQAEVLRRLAEVLTCDEELHVTVLLLGERPEEIGEWRRSCRAEVIATPFDEAPARHIQVADIVVDRARRMVERGDDVVVLVDSFTRLLRFCLAEAAPSGRAIGGVDAGALHRLRRYLGAARALDEGGSLTMVGSVWDDRSATSHALLEDLRDGANWELVLDREVAARGVRPPIDVRRSGTLGEERLIGEAEAEARAAWRHELTADPVANAERLMDLASAQSLERSAKGRRRKERALK